VFGGKELDELRQRKQALVLESAVNRLAFVAEWQHLRAVGRRASDAVRARRQFALPIAALAAVAGFFVARRRPVALVKRVIWAAKWAVPLYRLWKTLSSAAQPRRTEVRAP
jgi:hypothetical protein